MNQDHRSGDQTDRYTIPQETLVTLDRINEASKGIRRNLSEINSDLEKFVLPRIHFFIQSIEILLNIRIISLYFIQIKIHRCFWDLCPMLKVGIFSFTAFSQPNTMFIV
jgi:hypothetical protein